jgi:vitamin B12 transporter
LITTMFCFYFQHKRLNEFGIAIFIFVMLSAPQFGRTSDSSGLTQNNKYEMEEVVVTATRAETRKSEIAANVTVVSKKEIEKLPASNAAEVLQYIPGVYVEFNGGLGSDAAGVRIQGSESRHVTIFQDGVPLNQLANPQTDLSYIPVDAIDRIEIYKGAASSAWGSSLGGVVNIITKEPGREKPVSVDAQASYGEFKTLKSRGTVTGTEGRFGYLISVTHDESDGFIDHTEYDQNSVYAKVNVDLGETSRFNFAYFYDRGNNADPIPNFPDFWDDNDRRRSYQRLLFETSPADDLLLTIEARHHQVDNFIEDVYVDRREIFNDYKDEIWGGSARINWNFADKNTLNIGFDGDWGEYDWANYTKTYETGNWAVYGNDTLTLGNLSVNAGARYDDNKDFGSEISPSGGIVYRFSGTDALIRAQIARGFSAPPAAWVHDPQYGNPDLDLEISVNYQLGGQIRLFKFLNIELNLFQANVKDLIMFDYDILKYKNIEEVTRKGIEGTITASFDFGLTLSFSGSYVDVRNDATDQVIKDIPRTIYYASALYNYKAMTHSVIGKYIDHNSTYPETRDKVFIFDYLLKVRLPFFKKYGKTSMFGAVYNLFNSTYLYREVWPKPDRWVEGGLRFEF